MQSATNAYLKEAVHHNRASSKTGLLERLFTLWFRGFVYNQIWEDPRVDAEGLQLGADSRILTIASGGCNVLNYLIHDPAKIVAVDLNTSHMSLTRLKLAAVKALPTYEDFFRFFGHANSKENVEAYYEHIRPHLDDTTRKHWESSSWPLRKVGPKRIRYFKKGLYNQSKMGKLIRLGHRIARMTRKDPSRLLRATSAEQQQEVFDEVVAPFFDNRLVKWIGKSPLTPFSLGIPPSQFRTMKDESGGEVISLYRDRLYKLTCGFPMDDNYFAWQAFGRCYDVENLRALPDYLRRENWETIRNGVERVETHIRTLSTYLIDQEPGALNGFVFLDSQDWMPAPVIEELWQQIARVGEPGSRIIFRTAGVESPIEKSLPPDLMKRFTYLRDTSQELHDKDRSAIYGMFHVYRLEG